MTTGKFNCKNNTGNRPKSWPIWDKYHYATCPLVRLVTLGHFATILHTTPHVSAKWCVSGVHITKKQGAWRLGKGSSAMAAAADQTTM